MSSDTGSPSTTLSNEEVVLPDFTSLPQGAPARPGWPHPEALTFLRNLSTVRVFDTAMDSEHCQICQISFFDPLSGEHPVRLPCSDLHIVGSRCISTLLSPISGENNNCWYVFS